MLRREGRHEEARELLSAMAMQHPADAELHYEAACVHDFLGLEDAAVPYYLTALRGPLAPERRRSAFLGLGSTYRALGKYAEADATLEAGLAEFPDANDLKVFRAMVDYNLGRAKRAVESLLVLLAQTSRDDAVRDYAGAIAFYARDIDRVWPS